MRYVLGLPYTDEEVKEILENKAFEGTIVRSIIELQDATDKFNKELIKEIQLLYKILDWLIRRIDKWTSGSHARNN